MIFGRRANLENRITASTKSASSKEATDMATHRARVCIGYNDDGSPIVKRISRNSEFELNDSIVRTILSSERRREFVSDDIPAQQIPTLKEYTEEWLATYKQKRIRATTLGGYRTYLENHLYPFFGDVPLNRITTKDIQTMLNERSEMSHKSLQDMLILLRAILSSACKDRLIDQNPADDRRLYIPSDKKTVREALPVDHIREIASRIDRLSNIDDRRYLALLIFTGMRRGEVLGLRWEDIDLVSNEIHVVRNVTFPRGSNEPHIGEPKTINGYRDIPILPELLEHLKPLGSHGYIIGNCEKPNTLSIVHRRHERINRTIDMHGATPHIFRHSFATMLYDTGADIKTIQSIMGQSDYKTTADRYCHPRSDRNRTAMGALQDMITA